MSSTQIAAGVLLECAPLGIPEALRARPRWAPWAAAWSAQRGKWDKIPRQPNNPAWGLSSAKPEQWAAFLVASNSLLDAQLCGEPAELAGLGYCMTGPHGVVGVDLDNCVGADGQPVAWAAEVIAALASYTELSPSGNGYRIMCLGEVPSDWNNHERGIEVYGGHTARFLTVSGQVLPGSCADLQPLNVQAMAAIATQYARERKSAEVIDLAVPEILDDLCLPDLSSLALPDRARKFLESGDAGEDRSGTLHVAGIGLFAQGLDDVDVFSLLAGNPWAMAVALDHRRQDVDRAHMYLWREHVLKAKGKAFVVLDSDFDECALVANGGVEVGVEGGEPVADLPLFRRDKQGNIEASIENVIFACERADICGWVIKWDNFKDELMCAPGGRPGQWRAFGDNDYSEIRVTLERGGFKPVGRELIRDAVHAVAMRHQFDSAIDWLGGLKWDGVSRVAAFAQTYWGVDASDYATGVSEYLWSALAGRVLSPGVKADMVPVLVGAQGIGKTQSVAALSPCSDFFTEMSFAEDDKELARKMRGCLVAEIAELRGLAGREADAIKAFLSRTHETWVPKFKEFAVRFPRRLVFIGTTNTDQFLSDTTGNRRWLPLRPGVIDLEALVRDRDQLWAEAAELFRTRGVVWAQAQREAEGVHQSYLIVDPWTTRIEEWLGTPEEVGGTAPRENLAGVGTHDAMAALGLDVKNYKRADELRISAIYRTLGFVRKKMRIGDRVNWRFVFCSPCSPC